MRKISLFSLILSGLLLAGFSSGCQSGKKKKEQTVTPAYMKEEPNALQTYFRREREKKQQYERDFRDTRRPFDQNQFQVMPWHGKNYAPRSERLHENSLQNDNRIFNF